MGAEPRGTHQQGKPVSVEAIKRLIRSYNRKKNLRAACRDSDMSRPTARKYLGITPLPDLDI